MIKGVFKKLIIASLLLILMLAAGCSGGTGAQRIPGLSADEVVKTFFNAAKNNNLNEAGLYVSPASKGDSQTVLKYMSGQSDLAQIQNANLIAVKQVTEQGNYAVEMVTLQTQNSLNFTIKPVGLEKINGEWYIVDFNQIYNDAKYKILQQLIANI